MLWKQADDGVWITRISKALNPDHAYANYLGDPLTDTPYTKGAKKGTFRKIDVPRKECGPIAWPESVKARIGITESADAPIAPITPTRKKQIAVIITVYRDGTVEVQQPS
jgi:hypothetical protein